MNPWHSVTGSLYHHGSLDGMKAPNPAKGIYVVKCGAGTVKRVILR